MTATTPRRRQSRISVPREPALDPSADPAPARDERGALHHELQELMYTYLDTEGWVMFCLVIATSGVPVLAVTG